MMDTNHDDRAAVGFVDVLMMFLVLVSIIVLAPFFNKFTSMIQGAAGPFTSVLLSVFVPLVLVALLLSIGQSARGRT
jgi:hypothetical protein